MIKLKTVLVRAGILNSSNDCKTPEKVKVTLLKINIGAKIFNNREAKIFVFIFKPEAKKLII